MGGRPGRLHPAHGEDPQILDGLDPARVVLQSLELAARTRQMLTSGKVQWTVVADAGVVVEDPW